MKKVTFITTGQPTTNPRLVKEAESLNKLGYQVKVVYCFYQQWADTFDGELFNRNPGMYILCGGHPHRNKITYYKTRIRQKICQILFSSLKKYGVPENAISRAHVEAVSAAKKTKADIYIAHNLGALPAAVLAASYHHVKVGYDAEDMHSGQFRSDKNEMYLLNKYIEERYFNKSTYFTASSPLIAQYYKNEYPFINPVVINNVFLKTNLSDIQEKASSSPLSLFWFSQTIGEGRGIEEIILAMAKTISPVELHLMGQCSDNYKLMINGLIKQSGIKESQITIYDPIAPDALFAFAARFDIGLSAETGMPLNRDICLTNKIFTYLQSGLALIASDTQAQTLFLQQYPQTGKIYKKNDVAALAGCINEYIKYPDQLYQTKLSNYKLGQTQLNWETESLGFLDLVHSTLSTN